MADEPCYPLFADQSSYSDSTRFNKLGGTYQNGKPLPKWLRRDIIVLARNGVRQCDISRRLRITHGCVSKILSKYQRTGHFEAGGKCRGRRRMITTPRTLIRTDECCIQEQRRLFSWNTRRDPRCQENQCGTEGLRSTSSIRRSVLQTGVVEHREPGTSQEQGDCRRSPMISNILNLSSNEQSTTTSNESETRQQSESFPQRAVSRDISEDAYCPLPMRRIERIKYTSQQLRLLEAAFVRGKYLTRSIGKQLVKDTGLMMAKIQIWFSNRRARERKRASVSFCADSDAESSQGGMGNRYPDFLVAKLPSPLPPRNVGPSRIYFPLGHT